MSLPCTPCPFQLIEGWSYFIGRQKWQRQRLTTDAMNFVIRRNMAPADQLLGCFAILRARSETHIHAGSFLNGIGGLHGGLEVGNDDLSLVVAALKMR